MVHRRAVLVAGVLVVLGAAVLVAWVGFGGSRSVTPAAAGRAPRFVDEAASSGVVHTYDGPFAFAAGGGMAAFDCNDDGLPELYLAGGAGPAALFRNDSPAGGELRFTRLADPVTDLDGVNGAYPVDIDSDGWIDLVVLRTGPNAVLRGLGACRFEPATAAWGIDPGAASTTAFSATWERGATWPTLAFGRYVDASREFPDWCPSNQLVRPAAATPPGSGTAPAPAYGAALALDPSWCPLSMLFSDWDGSGRRDLRVSNDREYYPADAGEEQLWRIEPGSAPRLYTSDEGWVRVQVEGMGIATYDVTGDGLPEVYLTSQNASKLQTLSAGPAQPRYRDVGLRYGVNVAQPFTGGEALPSTAWHPEFEDVNDDGFIDLFVSKGNVTAMPDFAQRDPSNLLLGNPDGMFHEAADVAGILSFARGRGAAVVDLNLDGRLDLVELNYGSPVGVWRQDGAGATDRHWLEIRLRRPAPNVDAIGAIVEVRLGEVIARREVVVGGGHIGGELGWLHVGLGPSTRVEVRVTWPDGLVGPWQTVAADRHVLIEPGAEGIVPWSSAVP
jgi:hypothetical protein